MSSDWLGLAGKVAVVTGAAGGIGGAVVRAMAAAGARTVLLDRSLEAAEAAAALARLEHRADACAMVCDVADAASVTAAADDVAGRFGGADILVNTAAILRPGGLDGLSLADWNLQIAVNLTGCFLTAQAFGAQMRAKGAGAMVHVASTSASHPQAQSGAYSVTKAGLLMLSRQLAVEWGPHGIRSNVVSPGMVVTPMSAAFYADGEVRARREAITPLRRIGRPDDMADAAAFLASPRASYISGEEIVVDGAFSRMVMNLIPRPGFGS
jgi:NAD(P)-dependent dehydrogenase (short-subunit alcohol dehydrogenase family)